MHVVPTNDPVLHRLFEDNLPNSPALWAVLKGVHTGKAVVDLQRNPSQCVLRTDAALTYFSDQTSPTFLDKAIKYFRRAGSVWLVWPPSSTLKPPEIEDAKVIDRFEFYGYDPSSDGLEKLRKQLPTGHEMRTIRAELLGRCEWRDEMEYYAGSFNNFLKHGIGLCMLHENEIIVEAYASALGKTRAEIGALTHKDFRGRGYAPIACSYLIEVCEWRGYQAYWSCDADHTASIRVAQKLGFQHERAYQIFEYESLLESFL